MAYTRRFLILGKTPGRSCKIYNGGPLSENGTLSVEEPYAKIVKMGIVKPGDVAYCCGSTTGR